MKWLQPPVSYFPHEQRQKRLDPLPMNHCKFGLRTPCLDLQPTFLFFFFSPSLLFSGMFDSWAIAFSRNPIPCFFVVCLIVLCFLVLTRHPAYSYPFSSTISGGLPCHFVWFPHRRRRPSQSKQSKSKNGPSSLNTRHQWLTLRHPAICNAWRSVSDCPKCLYVWQSCGICFDRGCYAQADNLVSTHRPQC